MSEALGAAKLERTAGRMAIVRAITGAAAHAGDQARVAGTAGSRRAVFNRAIGALAALGTSVGGSAGGDVRTA